MTGRWVRGRERQVLGLAPDATGTLRIEEHRGRVMGFRLDLEEGLAVGVRRCVEEQLGGAAQRLEAAQERDRVEAVHRAREAITQTRAVLRLAADGMDPRLADSEQRGLRDAERALSVACDADGLEPMVAKLAERFAGALPAASFDALADWARTPSGEEDGDEPADRLADVADRLRAVVSRSESWALREDSRLLAAGTARAYRAGRRAFARVQRGEPSDAELHGWCKRVKDLWYQQRLLADLWPRVLDAQSRELARLAELLGDDHELVVLGERVRREPPSSAELDPDAVADLIARHRTELLDAARELGQRIYAERTRAYRRRIAVYLQAGALRTPSPASAAPSTPSASRHDAIARRAYEIFQAGGTNPLANWLQAEREVNPRAAD